MIIKNILYVFCLSAMLVAASCSSSPKGLEDLAMERLPEALEKAMEDQMSVKGGARIQSPEIIFDCDSLCIIHFQAVAKDPSGNDYSFPVRYVFLRDVFMSAAMGHPVYSEMVTGSPTMDRAEVNKFKEYCRETSDKLYIYYAGVAKSIETDDL